MTSEKDRNSPGRALRRPDTTVLAPCTA
ncbi:unnamed protein product, partial [Rotaria sp. Silwood1]